MFTESVIGLSVGFNEVAAIKILILETLPQALLCFAPFVHCRSCVLIMCDIEERDLFICTGEMCSAI